MVKISSGPIGALSIDIFETQGGGGTLFRQPARRVSPIKKINNQGERFFIGVIISPYCSELQKLWIQTIDHRLQTLDSKETAGDYTKNKGLRTFHALILYSIKSDI